MKRLLNTLYVLTEDTYLSLEDENVVISREDGVIARYPLLNLESICYFGYKGASPKLLSECVERGIDFCFFTGHGRFAARVCGESRGNILLRKSQYLMADDEKSACAVARNFILGKVYNSRWTLERMTRDHPLQTDVEKLKGVSTNLKSALQSIKQCESLEELRGIEGAAAQEYFSVFDYLILREKYAFYFHGRSKRPPLDRVNALLSFAYSLLASNCAAALEGVGLDSYAGIMHQLRPGRRSLALDLMEELRSVLADRIVLDCINNQIIKPEQFDILENESVLLNEDGRKGFLNAWQKKKQEEIMHPFLNEKIPWGLVPHAQAMLLARYLRGDLDEYPPFLWR